MKILLIHPPDEKVLLANNPAFVEKIRGKNAPLGIGYLASSLLKESTHSVETIDCQVQYGLLDKIRYGNYDVVGISILTYTLLSSLQIIGWIKKYSPRSKIIVGGTHPTIYPKEMLNLGVDIVVRGEAEKVLPDIINKVYKLSGHIHKHIGYEQELDKIPFPLRNNIDKYSSVFANGPATTIITSRGCHFGCKFCYRPVMGKRIRFRSPGNVVKELEACLSRGIKNFLFYDDTFTADKQRAIEICQRIRDSGMRISFDVRTRVTQIDEEILRMLKTAGMKQIRMGIESGVQKTLNNLRKGITLEQITKAFKLCNKLKIENFGYVMIGCPGETKDDIEETIRFVLKLNPDFIVVSKFTPFPATESYTEWIDKHQKDVWQGFASNPTEGFIPPIWGDIANDELEKLSKSFYRRFYGRPSYIANRLLKVRSFNRLKKYYKAGVKILKS